MYVSQPDDKDTLLSWVDPEALAALFGFPSSTAWSRNPRLSLAQLGNSIALPHAAWGLAAIQAANQRVPSITLKRMILGEYQNAQQRMQERTQEDHEHQERRGRSRSRNRNNVQHATQNTLTLPLQPTDTRAGGGKEQHETVDREARMHTKGRSETSGFNWVPLFLSYVGKHSRQTEKQLQEDRKALVWRLADEAPHGNKMQITLRWIENQQSQHRPTKLPQDGLRTLQGATLWSRTNSRGLVDTLTRMIQEQEQEGTQVENRGRNSERAVHAALADHWCNLDKQQADIQTRIHQRQDMARLSQCSHEWKDMVDTQTTADSTNGATIAAANPLRKSKHTTNPTIQQQNVIVAV